MNETNDIFKMLSAYGHRIPEDNYSDYLAYLLNPRENHGLHTAFLISFIKAILGKDNISEKDITNVSIYREKTYDNKRWIDIVVNFSIVSVDYMFIIENKTNGYSSDVKQLKEEYEILENFKEKQFYQIYLTPLKDSFKKIFNEWNENNCTSKKWLTWNSINWNSVETKTNKIPFYLKDYYRNYNITDYNKIISVIDIINNSGRKEIDILRYFNKHLLNRFIIKDIVQYNELIILKYFDNSINIYENNIRITRNLKEKLVEINNSESLAIDKKVLSSTNTQRAATLVIRELKNKEE